MIGAITGTLGLVLEHDVYSPSYDDPDGRHLAFLARVTKVLLRCVDDYADIGGVEETDDDDDAPSLLLASLHSLLLLNHRVIHERLADVIAFAWSCLSSSSSNEANSPRMAKMKEGADDLLSAIVKTYRELRQVGYFLRCTRGASKVSRSVLTSENNEKIAVLQLLEHHLSEAYQTDLPSGQLRGIWDFFDGWIAENVDVGVDTGDRQMFAPDEPKQQLQKHGDEVEGEESVKASASNIHPAVAAELSLAVEMFIVLIKNIRSNKQNCTELRSLCEGSMSTTAMKLLGTGGAMATPVDRGGDCDRDRRWHRMGLDMCGWLVDLHTRSCFWIDNADNDGVDDRGRGRGATFLLSGAHGDGDNDESNEDGDDKGLNVLLAYLRNVAETTLSTKRFKIWRAGDWLDGYWRSMTIGKSGSGCESHPEDEESPPPALRGSLQRLALHRIHQLHSMIYYCNLQENYDFRHAASDNDGDVLVSQEEDCRHSSSLALVNEARMLVDFSLYIASCPQFMMVQPGATTHQSSAYESLWASVAQSLCIWTHYSDPFHAEVFMIWFFTSLCQSNHWPHGDVDEPSLPVIRVEKTIALALARDASFYDVSEIMSLFMRVGIQVAIRKFLDNIDANTPGASRPPPHSNKINSELRRCGGVFTTISSIELTQKFGDAKLAHDDSVEVVSRVLSFLASAPVELSLCKENLDLLDMIVGLDILASHGLINHAQDDTQQLSGSPFLLNIVRSNEIIISNILPRTLLVSSDVDATCLKKMASHLITNCNRLSSDDNAVISSCNAISEYFSMCVDYYEKNDSMLLDFLVQMSSLVRDSGVEFSSKATITRNVIRRMNIFYRHHSPSKKIAAAKITSPFGLFLRFVLETLKHLHGSVIHHISNAVNGRENNDKLAASALLLKAEALSLVGNLSEYERLERHDRRYGDVKCSRAIMMTKVEISESVQELFDLVTYCQRSQQSIEFINASNYFLSVMAASPDYFLQIVSPSILLKHILESSAQSFASGQENPLLDAALCSLIRSSSGLEPMKTSIAHVLSESLGAGRRVDPTFITKIFYLLITCANSVEQHKYIASKCKAFLLISIGLLRDRRCATAQLTSNVKLFSKTMTTLISKKELLVMSGREIALICSEMNPLFIYDGVNVHDDAKGSSIFSCCCSVVASLIAHYPKQLYGCPSCLFSFLLALLSHILQTSARKGLSQKALEYAK